MSAECPFAWANNTAAYDDWCNDLLRNAPESWDDDVAQESIITSYVHELERRILALGGTLERNEVTDERCRCPEDLATGLRAGAMPGCPVMHT